VDQQIRDSEKLIIMIDFISALKSELSEIPMPNETVEEIRKYLNNDKMDYHSLHAIADILISTPAFDGNEDLQRLRSLLFIHNCPKQD